MENKRIEDLYNKEKPPIGLMPKWLHDEKRMYAVRDAISRYMSAMKDVPEEWVEEFNELAESFKKRMTIKETGEQPKTRGKSVLMEAAEKMGVDLSPNPWKDGTVITDDFPTYDQERVIQDDKRHTTGESIKVNMADTVYVKQGAKVIYVDDTLTQYPYIPMEVFEKAYPSIDKRDTDTRTDSAGTQGKSRLVDDDAYSKL